MTDSGPCTEKSVRDEMQRLVRLAAEPARPGELVKEEIRRAARFLGMDPGRVKRYWYGEIEMPPAHEVDAVRAKLAGRPGVRAIAASTPGAAQALPNSPRSRPPIHVVYDEHGRVWPADSPELREAVGITVEDFDLVEFVVRNFGWIEVKHEGARLLVRLSPRMAQSRALDQLYELLAIAPVTNVVVLTRVRQDWEQEVRPSGLDAAAHISALVNAADHEGLQRFTSTRQPLTVLFKDKGSRLADMLHGTRQLLGEETPDNCTRFASADPAGLMCVSVGLKTTAQDMLSWQWQHVGAGLRFYTPEERRRMVGSGLEQGPDREYGAFCARAYDRAASAGGPLVEDIRALVFRRHGPPVESRYRRLLVPFNGAEGDPIILVASELIAERAAA
jgi:hypothetical protein